MSQRGALSPFYLNWRSVYLGTVLVVEGHSDLGRHYHWEEREKRAESQCSTEGPFAFSLLNLGS
jgi:hypothetical protein